MTAHLEEVKKNGENDLEFWSDCYDENNVFWQSPTPNKILIDNMDKLTGQVGEEGGGKKKKFFVPLAGKSVDIPYLLEQGHRVFGLEGVAKAIEELNEENKLDLKFNAQDSVYYTEDQRLIIYCGNFVDCPIEKFGPFDCVWDHGSFIAIDFDLRPAYKKMMQKALLLPNYFGEGASNGEKDDEKYHDFRYLMVAVEFDRTKFSGPPRAVSEEDMKEIFGDWAHFEVLEGGQFHPDSEKIVQKIAEIGQKAVQRIYFMVPKKN